MLGIAEHQAEDALHSERAARAVLSRRSFFAAGAALAAGTAFTEVPVDLVRRPLWMGSHLMRTIAYAAYASPMGWLVSKAEIDLGPSP